MKVNSTDGLQKIHNTDNVIKCSTGNFGNNFNLFIKVVVYCDFVLNDVLPILEVLMLKEATGHQTNSNNSVWELVYF